MSQHVIVTGITTGVQPQAPVSQLPPRLEWQDFAQNLDYVTLYVKALQQFMNLTQSEVTSYFQIGGAKSFFIPTDNRYPWIALYSLEWCQRHS